MELLITVIGIAGALIILLAFGLNELNKLPNNSLTYDILNFSGSGLLIMNAAYFHSWPFLVLNIVWFLVSLRDIWKDLSRR